MNILCEGSPFYIETSEFAYTSRCCKRFHLINEMVLLNTQILT